MAKQEYHWKCAKDPDGKLLVWTLSLSAFQVRQKLKEFMMITPREQREMGWRVVDVTVKEVE